MINDPLRAPRRTRTPRSPHGSRCPLTSRPPSAPPCSSSSLASGSSSSSPRSLRPACARRCRRHPRQRRPPDGPLRRLGHPPRRQRPLPRKSPPALLARRRSASASSASTPSPPTSLRPSPSFCSLSWASAGPRRAFGHRTALYTGLGMLTSAGVFLFTRVFIPDVLLSLFSAAALYCFLHALDNDAGASKNSVAPHLDSETWAFARGANRTSSNNQKSVISTERSRTGKRLCRRSGETRFLPTSTPTSCGPPSPSPSSPKAW